MVNEKLGLETDLSFQEYNGPTRALGTRLIFINLQLILLNSILFIERLGLIDIVSIVLKGKKLETMTNSKWSIAQSSCGFSCEANRQHGTNKFSSFCSDSLLFDMSQFRKVLLWQIEV